MINISNSDIVKLFNIPSKKTQKSLNKILTKNQLRYRRLTSSERDGAILEIIVALTSGNLSKVGMVSEETLSKRFHIWSDVWNNTYQNYINSGGDKKTLNPSFIGSRNVFRYDGDFAYSEETNIEFLVYELVREWMASEYLEKVESIWEFGCGSGFNIAHFSERFPDKSFVGLDWAEGSNKILNKMGDITGRAIRGQFLNLFSPEEEFPLTNSAVFTFCALEQLGSNHKAFLSSIIKSKPEICIHMEPIAENYDRSNLFDELAYQYHSQRGYLDGFKTKLYELEDANEINILYDHRMRVGSFFHEGFSLLVWQPTCK